MDEQPTPASATTASATQQPETLAELAQTPLPATAAKAGVKSGPSTKKPTPQSLVNQASAQVEVLRQVETLKQLQKQVTLLETQSLGAGRVFLATVTTLITSAFALVAALAWNSAIQALFEKVFPPQAGQLGWSFIISAFGYALFITVIVVVVIFYLTTLNKRFGGQSLIGEAPKAEGGKKE